VTRPRRKPYTAAGIKRVPCARCGAPGVHQWQICSDGNQFRALCVACDIALNRLVLKWVGFPDWRAKAAAYAEKSRRPDTK